MSFNRLYLIEILHQTTTYIRCELILLSCILSKFYIKPQQRVRHKLGHSCCILSKFYIKPQLGVDRHLGAFVVSYRNSTSNHNLWQVWRLLASLYLIEILHQTTTTLSRSLLLLRLYLIEILHQTTTCLLHYRRTGRCILSKFYIKPQPPQAGAALAVVVSYRNSTSNHNLEEKYNHLRQLYLIEILHQTTTRPPMVDGPLRCILSKFYIKPQPKGTHKRARYGCILSKFYIKPQLVFISFPPTRVVSYRNSTSNHNC